MVQEQDNEQGENEEENFGSPLRLHTHATPRDEGEKGMSASAEVIIIFFIEHDSRRHHE